MRVLVTGGAGFIGSNLVRRLLYRGDDVVILDNLSSGSMENINSLGNKKLEFHQVNVLKNDIKKYMCGVEEVWHLAAAGDVRSGNENSLTHIEQNFLATINLLNSFKESSVKKLIFASSSTVYGKATKFPTPEGYSPLKPISIYGVSKLSSELAISAYSHASGLDAVIFRLANVVGAGSSRGVVYDLVEKLKVDSKKLRILGNGRQDKSYIYISDCINAMLIGSKDLHGTAVFNVASDDTIDVKRIADIISEEMNANPVYKFSGGSGGWEGDVPLMKLDTTKIKKRGWRPIHLSGNAVRLAVREML